MKKIFQIITDFKHKLVLENRYRISGSFFFALLCHTFLIGGYLGLMFLDKPEIEVIQEINFVDLTEIIQEPDVIQTKISDYPQNKSPLREDRNAQSAYINPGIKALPSKKIAEGKDEVFLDQKRQQVPLHLEKRAAVNSDIINPLEKIIISPARGIKDDHRIARPAEIDLKGAGIYQLVSNNITKEAISLSQNASPEINLAQERLVFKKEPDIKDFGLNKNDDSKMISDVQIADTETLITGPLANRQIEKKTIPAFPFWAKKQGFGAVIALRFTVMENGTVKENVIVERTSGSGEWDRLVIKALKTWKFESLEKINTRQDQSGVITFRFII